MPDWTSSMQRTYEYYVVDPGTWQDSELLTNVTKSIINRDSSVETLGSATIDVTESVGECYIRIYMVINQNGLRERIALGTFLVQTPSSSFDGRIRNVSMDGYTPLMELKENSPAIGYYIPAKEEDKVTNVADAAYRLTRENMRAPVVAPKSDITLSYDFVADTDDTWLSYLSDFLLNAKFKYDLDEMGQVLFAPDQDISALQPVWTYTDDNSSILYPELTMDHDLYGIPNVVEVVYYDGTNHKFYTAEPAVNDDPSSPTSTVCRGRRIVKRITDPDLPGTPNQTQLNDYAKQMLKAYSSIEYTVTYKHAYCPVRVGDCVRLNYTRAGITDVKAKVISQTIECTPECPVTEVAVFTHKLWG